MLVLIGAERLGHSVMKLQLEEVTEGGVRDRRVTQVILGQ